MRIVLDGERVQGTVAGAVDDDFDEQWLMDGRHAFPAKKTGSYSGTVTPDGSYPGVDVFAVVNHDLSEAASVSVAGQTVIIPPYGADGIARNGVKLITSPVTISGSFGVCGGWSFRRSR